MEDHDISVIINEKGSLYFVDIITVGNYNFMLSNLKTCVNNAECLISELTNVYGTNAVIKEYYCLWILLKVMKVILWKMLKCLIMKASRR